MALIGSTPVFNIFKDDWTLYTEILEQFFEINSIDENKKCAYLISVIGQDCYKILSEICYPETPKNKSYDELCNLLSKHFENKNSVFVIRNKFYRASKYPNESITLWFNRVKKLSKECRFTDNIESILVDRFISGLKYFPLDGFFNEMEPISLDKAFNMALERERYGKQDIDNISISSDERNDNNFKDYLRRRGNIKKNMKTQLESEKSYPVQQKPTNVREQENDFQNKVTPNSSNETKTCKNMYSWKAGPSSTNSVKVDPIDVVSQDIKNMKTQLESEKRYPVQQIPKNFYAQQFQNISSGNMANNDSGTTITSHQYPRQFQQNSPQVEPSFSGYIPQGQKNRNDVRTKPKKDDLCVLS